jgi:hypothetical protein
MQSRCGMVKCKPQEALYACSQASCRTIAGSCLAETVISCRKDSLASTGPCDVEWHVDRRIVAVACVGRDMIKVWPLPMVRPWWEDAIEMSDGELARRG